MVKQTHVLVFAMPIQGHINPMLQFSKLLVTKGLMVTFITTSSSISKSTQVNSGLVNIETFPDDFDKVVAKSDSTVDFIDRLKDVVKYGLSKLMEEKKNSKSPPKIIIYDSILPWMLGLARENGLLGAVFFTQTCCVCSVIYHLHKKNLTIPIEGDNVDLPGLPLMGMDDIPLFFYNGDENQSFMGFMMDQFSNIREVDWVLFNTFEELEEEAVSFLRSQFPLKTIGPTIPSININKNTENENGSYGLSLFKASSEPYMEWLSTKPKASVIYVSFGSLASLKDDQMLALSQALKNSNHYYLWVVRASEESKLPSKIKDESCKKGFVVNWCAQIEVLAHDSIGCFMTHCGWNSTIEGLNFGVPMVAMPQWSDQPTNAKCIEDMWGVGVRVKGSDKGIVLREEIESCIAEVMGGEGKRKFRKNSAKWKMLANRAVGEGGSSDKNIDEFVSEITFA